LLDEFAIGRGLLGGRSHAAGLRGQNERDTPPAVNAADFANMLCGAFAGYIRLPA
jgi:hypothetical protein